MANWRARPSRAGPRGLSRARSRGRARRGRGDAAARDAARLPRQVAAEVLRQARGASESSPCERGRIAGSSESLGSRRHASIQAGRGDRRGERCLPRAWPWLRCRAGRAPGQRAGRTEMPEIGQALEARLVGADAYAIPRAEPASPSTPTTSRTRWSSAPGARANDSFRSAARATAQDAPDRREVPRWDRAGALVEAGGTIVWVGHLRRGARPA